MYGILMTERRKDCSKWDVLWYEKNIFGDVVAVYDASGTKLESYTYDAYGNCTVTMHVYEDEMYVNNPFRYRGYYYDIDLKLYYVASRYYDSMIGRWISPEANVYTGKFDGGSGLVGYNVYAYCANNPVNYSDPTGEAVLTTLLVSAFVGAIIGGAIGGVLSCASASSSGSEGYDLFLETTEGMAKGLLIGGAAGGIGGTVACAASVFGAASVAGTAAISATATVAAKATEVTALQARKSISDGDNGWQVAGDCLDSVFSNGGEIVSPIYEKGGSTVGMYWFANSTKYKFAPIAFTTFLYSKPIQTLSYISVAYNWYETTKSILCADPIARANQRGYGLR